MRVLLVSFGSMGEVMPFLALGQALRRRDHGVRLALPRHLIRSVPRLGVDLVPVGPDVGEAFRRAQIRISEGRFSIEDYAERNRVIGEIAPQCIETLTQLARTVDVVVGVYGLPFLSTIQRVVRVPVVVVRIDYPGHESPLPAHGEAYSDGLGPLRPALEIYALSRTVFTLDAAESSSCRQSGFFFTTSAPSPLPELEAFLESGPAPVVVSLGSMMHADPARLESKLREATARAGCRAIIQSGWSGIGRGGALTGDVLSIEYVPHDYLFPRAACVVHHSGIGTTAAALRHGIAMVLVPHGVDQFAIADRVQALGCASAVVPYSELSVTALAEALSAALRDEPARACARRAAATIAGEPGVEGACDWITAESRAA